MEQEIARLEGIARNLGRMMGGYGHSLEAHCDGPERCCGSGADPSPRPSSWRRLPCGRGQASDAAGQSEARRTLSAADALRADPEAEMAEKLLTGSENEVVAKNLEAHRLTLSGRPSFDPLPHLDPEARSHYLDPFSWMIEPDAVTEILPKPKIRATRVEKQNVLRLLLDSTDRLRFVMPPPWMPMRTACLPSSKTKS